MTDHNERLAAQPTVAQVKAEALRELRDSFRPGDGNPWVKYVHTVLTNRANRIESEG